jgi:hypothetical protein
MGNQPCLRDLLRDWLQRNKTTITDDLVDALAAHCMMTRNKRGVWSSEDVDAAMCAPGTQKVMDDPEARHQSNYGASFRGSNASQVLQELKDVGYRVVPVPDELKLKCLPALKKMVDEYEDGDAQSIFQSCVVDQTTKRLKTIKPEGQRITVANWGGAHMDEFVSTIIKLWVPEYSCSVPVLLKTLSRTAPQRAIHTDGNCSCALSLIVPLSVPKVDGEHTEYSIDVLPGSHNSYACFDDVDPKSMVNVSVPDGHALLMIQTLFHNGKANFHTKDSFASIFCYLDAPVERMIRSYPFPAGEKMKRWLRTKGKNDEGSTMLAEGKKVTEWLAHDADTADVRETEWNRYICHRSRRQKGMSFMDLQRMTMYEHCVAKQKYLQENPVRRSARVKQQKAAKTKMLLSRSEVYMF